MQLIRSILFITFAYLLMAVMGLVCSPALLGPRSWARACMTVYLKLTFWALRVIGGVTWEVRGREHLPSGGALIASKHQSMFETLAAWQYLEDPAIILKKELKWLPFFGWWAQKLRNIVVDRSAASKALREMTKQAKERAREGRQVVIFPEGTRVEPGETAGFKPGVAALYGAMECPCVPVALNSGLVWSGFGWLKRPGHIVIEILPPIPPGLNRKEFIPRLKAAIDENTDRLVKEGA